MSSTASLDNFHDAPRERRFLLVLAVLRSDAIQATRSYRIREIHRGRGLCGANLCDECEQDVQVAVFELFDRYERAHAAGRTTELTSAFDAIIAASMTGTESPVSGGYLRAVLANAGKDARRKFDTALGRSAKPEDVLAKRADFQPLRDRPLLLEVMLVMVQLATSNTPLPRSVLPYARMAEWLTPRLEKRGLDAALVNERVMPRLVNQAMSIAEAVDATWVSLNVTGPLSERLTELPMPDGLEAEDDQGQDGEPGLPGEASAA